MINLDNNATTRPTDAVCRAVQHACCELWHNPSSVHRAGQEARNAVELARADIAALLQVKPRQVTFTSSGTESIHLAIRGVLAMKKNPILVTTAIEHAAVRELAAQLEKYQGVEVRHLPLLPGGIVDLEQAADLIQGATLASVQWVNNETGVVQPIGNLARLCDDAGVCFHCDATQLVGRLPIELGDDGMPPCDLLSCSAHKFHGPKGVGILWARPGVGLLPLFPGSQELGRRGGTENVPGILGAGAAAREAAAWLTDPAGRQQQELLRDRLETSVLAACPDAVINAPTAGASRIWTTASIGFPGIEAEALLILLSEQGLCASAGAACSSGSLEPSPVLLAMGVPPRVAHGSIRFSLSRDTTESEIDDAATIIAECVHRLRHIQ